MPVPLRVGLVAGEASGDTLGADLIAALRRLAPDTEFFRRPPVRKCRAPAAKSGAPSRRRHGLGSSGRERRDQIGTQVSPDASPATNPTLNGTGMASRNGQRKA